MFQRALDDHRLFRRDDLLKRRRGIDVANRNARQSAQVLLLYAWFGGAQTVCK